MKHLKVVKVGGTPYEMGYDYGKECRDQIQYFAREALLRQIAGEGAVDMYRIAEIAKDTAKDYEPYIIKAAPHLIEEIRGIGDGAQIRYQQALMLQCRSELIYQTKLKQNARNKSNNHFECSSFAISRNRSADGQVIVGQNVDLGAELEELGLILCLYPKEGPSVMTWTLAGTVGQVGLNSAGMARCGNVLICPGWRVGLPTTIIFRRILEMPTVLEVVELVKGSYRAKSNNFVVGDKSDAILDLETTTTDHRLLQDDDGIIIHTNHYIHTDFTKYEMFYKLEDSKIRLDCLQKLFNKAPRKIDTDYLKSVLSSHDTDPHSVCVHASDASNDTKTVLSVILKPEAGTMLACPGNPCRGAFVSYNL